MAANPAPRDFVNSTENPPAVILSWQQIDEAECTNSINNSPIPNTATYCIVGGGSVLLKRGRRRRYTVEERKQVAERRKLGACEKCRAARTKCLHDSPPAATDQYRMESQSHEQFALGLTTPSSKENEHGHKQVMEKKIADIDHKFVGAQKEDAEQKNIATQDPIRESTVATGSILAPKLKVPVGLPGQQRKHFSKLHNVQTHHTVSKTAQPGVNKPFRVDEGQKLKQGRQKKQKMNQPSVAKGQAQDSNISNSMAAFFGPKAAVIRQPLPLSAIQSAHGNGQPSEKQVDTLHSSFETGTDGNSSGILEPHRSLVSSRQLEPPIRSFVRLESEWRPSRISKVSENGIAAYGNQQTLSSLERSPSPGSEYGFPCFVCLSQLSLSNSSPPSQNLTPASFRSTPETTVCDGDQSVNTKPLDSIQDDSSEFYFTEYLHEWDQSTLISENTNTYFNLTQNGGINLSENNHKIPGASAGLQTRTDSMEIDSTS